MRWIILFTVLLYAAVPAWAAEPVYRLHQYALENKENLAAEALIDAFSANAVNDLLKNLVPAAEQDRVGVLEGVLPNSRTLQSVKLLPTESRERGVALADITFAREPVRQLLNAQKIPFADMLPLDVVVVPLWSVDGTVLPVGAESEWQKVFASRPHFTSFFHYRVVDSNLPELQQITPELLRVGAGDVLEQLAASMKADIAIVAVNEMRSFSDTANAQIFGSPQSGVPPVRLSQPLTEGADYPQKLKAFADNLLKRFEEVWKENATLELAGEDILLMRYEAANGGEVNAVLAMLKTLPQMSRAGIRLLSSRECVFEMYYQGGLEQLRHSLNRNGFALEETRLNNVWKLNKTTGTR